MIIWKTCFLGVFAQFVLLKRAGKIRIVFLEDLHVFSKSWKTFLVILVKRKIEDSKIGFRQERLIQRPF